MDKVDYKIGKYELIPEVVFYITGVITIASMMQIIYWVIKH
jgi:hypothetical protein